MRLINRFLTVQAVLVVSEDAKFAALRMKIAAQLVAEHPWLTLDGERVTAVDFAAYAKTVGRQKTPPAFDALDLSSGENQLFGSASKTNGTSPPIARHTAASLAPAWQMRRPSNK